mgnify:CR=1 FL=1
MDLILWRHADAEDGTPDLRRALTRKGEKQAEHMAAWLSERLPPEPRIIVSPALRTQQTARALSHDFETLAELAPDASSAQLLDASGWPEAGRPVIVVGHQPALGQVAAQLLTGRPAMWTIRKGAVFWLTRRLRGETPQVLLRAVLSPEFL